MRRGFLRRQRTVGALAALGLGVMACSTTNANPSEGLADARGGPERVAAPAATEDAELRAVYFETDSAILRQDLDARVLKWSPWANLLGLHTSYARERGAGRYADLEAERHEPRTGHSLVRGAPLDAFALRRKHELLAPLVDASYGSATFASADRPSKLEVRVSTTGLLVREERREL